MSGYELMETEAGVPYDVSFCADSSNDVIVIDPEGPVYLTKSDLTDMLEMLQ